MIRFLRFLVIANTLVAGETEIEFAAPFVDGSDVYAFYWRTHTTGPREVGLAKMSGGTPPFVRQTFPNTSTLFGDTYSLFEDGDLQPASGGVVSGSDLYLYGLQLPGGATSHEVFSARVPLNGVTQASSYEYWTASGWQSAPTTPAALWDNSGAPSVAYNTQEARWAAVYSVEQSLILPYVQEDNHSALAVRVAENLEGPWSEPVVVWERPQTLLTGTGSVHSPVILPGLENGSAITVAANDGGEWTRPENAYLYEIDLSQLTFPPALDLPSDPTSQNPHPAAGFANSGDLVRIFVNGEEQGSDTAQADGSFEISIVLLDGPNSVYAVADSGGQTSDPSAVVTYNYENAESRTVSGSITTDTVWTPGQAPGNAGPYIIGSNLTIDPTATLTIQPDVEVRVDGLYSITVDGGLVVQGVSGQRVVLRSDAAPPGHQDWLGLTVNGQAVLEEVDIRNTSTAIRVAGGDLQLSNATITQFVDGVQFQAGGTGHLGAGTLIDNAAGWPIGSCIELKDAGTVTIDSVEAYRCRHGLTLIRSSPDVQASTFSDHEYHGILIKDGSNPDIFGGNAITNNGITGVRVERGSGQAVDPAPIIRESDLFGNASWDYYVINVGAPLQASGNWWGTTDLATIAGNIHDSSDSASAAIVQWTPFLNDSFWAGGTVVPGSYLNGPVVEPVEAGVTHMVVGDLLVESGQVATLEAGAHLQFLPGMRFIVDGTLDIAGSASQLVHLESAGSSPAPGDWDGIYISATSVNSQIRHALIEHADYGVHIDQAPVGVSDSQVLDAKEAGIYLNDSTSQLFNNILTLSAPPASSTNSGIHVVEPAGGAANPGLIGNTIQDYRNGIWIQHSSTQAGTGVVSVTGNTLEAAKFYGLRIEGTTAPAVTGNLIRNNTAAGILLSAGSGGYPTPTIQGNDIHDNGSNDLDAGAFPVVGAIDASKNWWGTTDPVEIADKINDRTDSANRPVVGFTPFLDASILANGQEFQGDYVTGGSLAPGTTFSSGTTYVVTGVIDVPVGETLTVESGATLSFLPDTRLEVAGTLDAQGGLFTSANTPPGQNDWEGIQVLPGSTGSVLDGIIVKWAKDSVDVDGADVDITNSTFQEFGLGGITYRNSATGTISNNTVNQGQQNARGIEVVDSSPTIINNDVLARKIHEEVSFLN
ncbi:MAG: DUF4185 domain-containing protein [bacterium]|nr:DUF4185 domain-containing protein [bacterium]